MVLPDLRREFEIRAKKCGPQFGYEFFAGIAFVAPALTYAFAQATGEAIGAKAATWELVQRSGDEVARCGEWQAIAWPRAVPVVLDLRLTFS